MLPGKEVLCRQTALVWDTDFSFHGWDSLGKQYTFSALSVLISKMGNKTGCSISVMVVRAECNHVCKAHSTHSVVLVPSFLSRQTADMLGHYIISICSHQQ